ncbi:hypothetical protein R6Q57_002164 [Mikania cordata]
MTTSRAQLSKVKFRVMAKREFIFLIHEVMAGILEFQQLLSNFLYLECQNHLFHNFVTGRPHLKNGLLVENYPEKTQALMMKMNFRVKKWVHSKGRVRKCWQIEE